VLVSSVNASATWVGVRPAKLRCGRAVLKATRQRAIVRWASAIERNQCWFGHSSRLFSFSVLLTAVRCGDCHLRIGPVNWATRVHDQAQLVLPVARRWQTPNERECAPRIGFQLAFHRLGNSAAGVRIMVKLFCVFVYFAEFR
jgi:hypothetical protein